MPSKTGIWDQQEADNNHIFSYRIAKWIAEFLNKDIPLYDFGCGKGTYAGYFEDRGFKNVIGIDGMLYEGKECSNMIAADLTDEINCEGKGNILCLEVGEHIPEEHLDAFIDNLTYNCEDILILSWAVPGQEGIGHVSCRTNEWVIDQLKERGFVFMPDPTSTIRMHAEGFVNYFKETILIFKKTL